MATTLPNDGATPSTEKVNLSECPQDGQGKTGAHKWEWYKDPGAPNTEFPTKQHCIVCGEQRMGIRRPE